MEPDGRIRTQFDDLVSAIRNSGGKTVRVAELASVTGLSTVNVMKWLAILEKNGQVHVENRLTGVYVVWSGEREAAPLARSATGAESVSLPINAQQSEIEIARQNEQETRKAREQALLSKAIAGDSGQDGDGQEIRTDEEQNAETEIRENEQTPQSAQLSGEELAMLRHRQIIESAGEQLLDVGEKIEKIGTIISELKKRKGAAARKNSLDDAKKGTAGEMTEIAESAQDSDLPDSDGDMHRKEEFFGEPGIEEPAGGVDGVSEDSEPESAPARKKWKETMVAVAEKKQDEPPAQELDGQTLFSDSESGLGKIQPIYPKRKIRIGKMKRPEPAQPTSASLQFSERLARHVKKITAQTQEIEKLKMEKEKLLSEHYVPMQRRLEVEIETISDRVLRMEKNILSMQQRASELPNRVQTVEKLQISTIKAHAEMRRAHDEASALVEEAALQLSGEREKMAMMVEQSRQEIAEHRAKSEELAGTIEKISQMEEEAANLVISARGALAEQAERLASAEKNAQELAALKEGIAESVATAKREMAAAKGVLSGLEKQMTQMRQIEVWAGSIKQDYEKKMLEIDDYIRNGNGEFETLRESVEANFVRRYLRELRQLTDSYTFELNQVKNAEGNIDQRISEEKAKLDALGGGQEDFLSLRNAVARAGGFGEVRGAQGGIPLAVRNFRAANAD